MRPNLHQALMAYSGVAVGGDIVQGYKKVMDLLLSAAGAVPNGHDKLLSTLRDANIALFTERGFPLSSRHHAMLQTCKDHVWLDRWLRRGINATCPADVFD